MAKAKQIADQYGLSKSRMELKTSALTEEKRKTEKSVVSAMSFKGEEVAKKLGREARIALTNNFKEENKELIIEYKRLGAEHRKNEKLFQKLFAKAKKEGLTDLLDKESFKEALMGETEKKESKEKMKTPELEAENHKIDRGLPRTKENGWKEEERPANGRGVKIKILKKELAPGAFVREYQDDGIMPKHLVGEQLFNWKAVLSLGLEDRLPTYKQYQEMGFSEKGGEDHKKAFDKYFQKTDNYMLPGYWDRDDKGFNNIGRRTDCWLSDGDSVEFNEGSMTHSNTIPGFGFSLRLLKN